MKLRFWRKNKWIQTPAQTIVVPAGKYTVYYTVKTDGKGTHTSTTVYPQVTKEEL